MFKVKFLMLRIGLALVRFGLFSNEILIFFSKKYIELCQRICAIFEFINMFTCKFLSDMTFLLFLLNRNFVILFFPTLKRFVRVKQE